MENCGLNGCVPRLTNTDSELCPLCKERVEDVSHFLSSLVLEIIVNSFGQT